MSETKPTTAGEQKADVKETPATTSEVNAPKPPADIIRGRMPALIVFMIKFNEPAATVAALAAKYKTTVGKVSDVQKDRNFQYITKDFAPTSAMVEDAKKFAENLPDSKVIIEEINKITIATDEQVKAYEALKKTLRPGRKAAETPAPTATPEATPAAPTAGKMPDLSGITQKK